MTVSLLPLGFAPLTAVPLLDLPGLLARQPGPEHQLARVETFSAPEPGAAGVELARCRCGRLFDAAGMARHLTPAPASAAAVTDRPTPTRRTR